MIDNTPRTDERTFLTPAQVAERYNFEVSTSTLAIWRHRGHGPGYMKLGRKILYPLDQLQDWEVKRLRGARQ